MKYSTKQDQLIKGIVLGVLFSTKIFESRFTADFQAKINGIEPPLKGIILAKVTEIFTDDERKLKVIYNWVNKNFYEIFDEGDVDFIIHVMNQVEFNVDRVRMN